MWNKNVEHNERWIMKFNIGVYRYRKLPLEFRAGNIQCLIAGGQRALLG